MAALQESHSLRWTCVLRPLVRLSSILIALIVLSSYVFAQTGDPDSRKDPPDRESSSIKAYSRVKTAIIDAQSLRLMPNRVRVQVLAACLLWPADEARARSVIRDATAAALSYLASLDKSERDAPQIRLSYNRLRNELLTL